MSIKKRHGTFSIDTENLKKVTWFPWKIINLEYVIMANSP